MSKAIFFAAVVIGSVSIVGQARAAGAPQPPPAAATTDRNRELGELVARERPTRRVFYGWEILATGETAAVVVAASVMLPSKPLDSLFSTGGFVIGMPTYLLAGPVIHWSHDSFTKGLISFGSNSAFALVGGFIGESVHCSSVNDDKQCGSDGFFKGVGIGALVAPLIDAMVLGWDNVPLDDTTTESARGRAGGVAWAPTWAVGPRGTLSLGVAGRF